MNDDQPTLPGNKVRPIPVTISYGIIKLLSDDLYRSPHKAIEELVCNSYDADAREVRVILPDSDQTADSERDLDPLWVIDNGRGMDAEGFEQLWKVAESQKEDETENGRLPIGQFGIGKLAAYVLAWNLVHVSYVSGRFLLTVMDFNVFDKNVGASTVHLPLQELTEEEAKGFLADVERRDPKSWSIMFGGQNRSPSWTATGLSNFKDKYKQVKPGTLRWVLSTTLPLHSKFKIFLEGDLVTSHKENIKEIDSIQIEKSLSGIGTVIGEAKIYEQELTKGKSAKRGRSHGFFIRVRKRVINLADELFGVRQLNHAAWSRFALEVEADGLREHLLSAREGVKDNDDVKEFREYLLSIFNKCRKAYENWEKKEREKIDIANLLSDEPSVFITDPLSRSVRATVEAGSESFYIQMPRNVDKEDAEEWLGKYTREVEKQPFVGTEFKKEGPNAPIIHYDPSTRKIFVNSEHPFVIKLTAEGRHRNSARIFAGSEILLEGQLQEQGVSGPMIANFLRERDKILRVISRETPPTATDVLRWLRSTSRDKKALEPAVGAAFRVLGFEYERRGGNRPGCDGVLFARLGRHGETLADYKLVYDSKTTSRQSVRAQAIDVSNLERFRQEEKAQFGFFIASEYTGERDESSALNEKVRVSEMRRLTLLKIDHLRTLVELHYQYGVTLTEIRSLFETSRTVPNVDAWIDNYRSDLAKEGEVPLSKLLSDLEDEKRDLMANPNIIAVRAKSPELRQFEPERLIARLEAVERIVGKRWIEYKGSGNVVMRQTAGEIMAEFDRNIGDLEIFV